MPVKASKAAPFGLLPFEPSDREAVAVWSDALMQAGDPLGECVALGLRSTKHVDAGQFVEGRARQEVLLSTYGAMWLGGVSPQAVSRWRYGLPFRLKANLHQDIGTCADSMLGRFIEELDLLTEAQSGHLTDWFSFSALRGLRIVAGPQGVFPDLFHQPGFSRLRRLAIESQQAIRIPAPPDGLLDLRLFGAVTLSAPWPQALTSLSLKLHDSEQIDIVQLASIAALQKVTLSSSDGRWLPSLTRLCRMRNMAHIRLEEPFEEDTLERVLREVALLSRVKKIELYGTSISTSLRRFASKCLPRLIIRKDAPGDEPW
jgi:hypothetical protein